MPGTLFRDPLTLPQFASTPPGYVIIFFPRFLVRLFYCNAAAETFEIKYRNCTKVALLMGGLMGYYHQGSQTGSS